MSITVRFICGHGATVGNRQDTPVCPTCGETEVTRTSAPPPRFRGSCSGPYAETVAMTPGIVSVAPKGPLIIKEQQ